MKNLKLLFLGLLFTGCAASFHLSTLNHDPIYDTVLIVPADVQVDTLTVSQLRWKLRTDFRFRYDFAQYALSQPRSFDWNNRVLGNRYSFFNQYSFGYNTYMSRDMMWNDWVWGYNGWNSWGLPLRWSPFGYDRWGYNIHYGWNNHGWGYNYYGWGYNYYGWNNRYRNSNDVYRGRKATTRNGRAHASMIEATKRNKTRKRVIKTNTKPRMVIRNNNTPIIRTKPVRRTRTVIPSVRVNTPTRTTRVVSNRTQPARKVNSRRKN